MDHFHLIIMKEKFRLTPRDYSVYWHVMLSPSRNLCTLTGRERDSPTVHLAGDVCSAAYSSCCFLGLLIHGTESFTDKKRLKMVFLASSLQWPREWNSLLSSLFLQIFYSAKYFR